MDEIERLIDWIHDYFPDPSYTRNDVKEYMESEVAGWHGITTGVQNQILDDWEYAIEEQVSEVELKELPEIKRKGGAFWSRIKAFLGRLFGGR